MSFGGLIVIVVVVVVVVVVIAPSFLLQLPLLSGSIALLVATLAMASIAPGRYDCFHFAYSVLIYIGAVCVGRLGVWFPLTCVVLSGLHMGGIAVVGVLKEVAAHSDDGSGGGLGWRRIVTTAAAVASAASAGPRRLESTTTSA